MHSELSVITEQDAVPALVSYLHEKRLDRLTLVADANTYAALGERVDLALAAAGGVDIKRILLAGDEVTPDETTCMEVFVANGSDERTFLAVGSGVITDVTRFVSHRSRNAFICLPTAPSVDAYTATGSSLVLKRLKRCFFEGASLLGMQKTREQDSRNERIDPIISARAGNQMGSRFRGNDGDESHGSDATTRKRGPTVMPASAGIHQACLRKRPDELPLSRE